MSAISQTLKTPAFSLSAFLQGLAGGALILLLLLIWAFLRGDKVVEIHQSRLASKTVLIERPVRDSPKPLVQVSEKSALPPAPFDGMVETGAHGDMPRIRERDNLSAFDAYKKPFTSVAGQSKLAIVLNNVGLSKRVSEQILNSLPNTVTAAISSYARNADGVFMQFRGAGHESWLMLPVEGVNFGQNDPGPKAILKNASLEKNLDNLSWNLSQGTGYAGVIAPKGHIYQGDITAVKIVFQQIFERGLALFENNKTINSNMSVLALRANVPHAGGNFYLDNQSRRSDILGLYEAVEMASLRNGHSVIVIEPTPVNMKLLPKWAASLSDKGIQIAPLSAVLEE